LEVADSDKRSSLLCTEWFTSVISFIARTDGQMLYNFLRPYLMTFGNKLECLSLAGLSSQV